MLADNDWVLTQVFEASELGWPPGHWPEHSDFGELFHVIYDENGDIAVAEYLDTENEEITRVFND